MKTMINTLIALFTTVTALTIMIMVGWLATIAFFAIVYGIYKLVTHTDWKLQDEEIK